MNWPVIIIRLLIIGSSLNTSINYYSTFHGVYYLSINPFTIQLYHQSIDYLYYHSINLLTIVGWGVWGGG